MYESSSSAKQMDLNVVFNSKINSQESMHSLSVSQGQASYRGSQTKRKTKKEEERNAQNLVKSLNPSARMIHKLFQQDYNPNQPAQNNRVMQIEQ